MTRKLLSLCLVLLLCISLLPAVATAQETNEFVIVSDKSSLQVDDTLIVTIKGVNMVDLFATEVNVAFDAARLEYQGVVYGSPNSVRVLQGNTIELAKTGMAASGSADLFQLEFKAKAAGRASLTLTDVEQQSHDDAQNRTSQKRSIGQNLAVEVLSENPSSESESPGTPSQTPAPTGTPKPFGSVIRIEAVTDAEGVASIAVDQEALQAAIGNAKEGTVTIEVKPSDETRKAVVQIPVESIRSAKDNHVNTVVIDIGFASVTLNLDLLKETDISGSGNFELSVAKMDASALPAEVREKLEVGQLVYDFSMSVGGVKITSFEGKDVRLTIPYVLKPQQNPNKVVVYYIADDGSLAVIKNGRYNTSTGKAEFRAKRFSKYLSAYAQVSFQDIAGVNWAQDAIEGLAAREAVNGVGGGNFNPEGNVTRAEFIAMLTRVFDLTDERAETAFADVAPGAWYYDAIATAEKLGIVYGNEDGSFGINEKISRQDMAVMIYRTIQLLHVSLPTASASGSFEDDAEIAGYARGAVTAMKSAGIVDGLSGGKFAPADSSTRAQAATIIYRLYQLVN